MATWEQLLPQANAVKPTTLADYWQPQQGQIAVQAATIGNMLDEQKTRGLQRRMQERDLFLAEEKDAGKKQVVEASHDTQAPGDVQTLYGGWINPNVLSHIRQQNPGFGAEYGEEVQKIATEQEATGRKNVADAVKELAKLQGATQYTFEALDILSRPGGLEVFKQSPAGKNIGEAMDKVNPNLPQSGQPSQPGQGSPQVNTLESIRSRINSPEGMIPGQPSPSAMPPASPVGSVQPPSPVGPSPTPTGPPKSVYATLYTPDGKVTVIDSVGTLQEMQKKGQIPQGSKLRPGAPVVPGQAPMQAPAAGPATAPAAAPAPVVDPSTQSPMQRLFGGGEANKDIQDRVKAAQTEKDPAKRYELLRQIESEVLPANKAMLAYVRDNMKSAYQQGMIGKGSAEEDKKKWIDIDMRMTTGKNVTPDEKAYHDSALTWEGARQLAGAAGRVNAPFESKYVQDMVNNFYDGLMRGDITMKDVINAGYGENFNGMVLSRALKSGYDQVNADIVVPALKENQRRETITRDFVNRIEKNNDLFKKLAKKYDASEWARIINKPINEIINSKIKGSGEFASLKQTLMSTSREVAKVEASSLGMAGAHIGEIQEWDKVHDINMPLKDIIKVLENSDQLGKNSVESIADESKRLRDSLKKPSDNHPDIKAPKSTKPLLKVGRFTVEEQ